MFRFIVSPIKFSSQINVKYISSHAPCKLQKFNDIKAICHNYSPKSNTLYREFIDNVNVNKITNMTPLMKKYNITGEKLLRTMYNGNKDLNVYNMDWTTAESLTGQYIEQYNNKFLCNYFNKHIPTENNPQYIDVDRYDYYNGTNSFYNCVILMLHHELTFSRFYKHT